MNFISLNYINNTASTNMTSTPPSFAGLTDPQINEITDFFNDHNPTNDQDPVMNLSPSERSHMRFVHLWLAIIKLLAIKGVSFPDLCHEMLDYRDTATKIEIGICTMDLNGICFHGNIISLECEEDPDNTVHFTSFPELVTYVKSMIAHQSLLS